MGEAKDLMKYCIQQPSAEGYDNVLELLESRSGDSPNTDKLSKRN